MEALLQPCFLRPHWLWQCHENGRCIVARALGKILCDQFLVLVFLKEFISELCKDSRIPFLAETDLPLGITCMMGRAITEWHCDVDCGGMAIGKVKSPVRHTDYWAEMLIYLKFIFKNSLSLKRPVSSISSSYNQIWTRIYQCMELSLCLDWGMNDEVVKAHVLMSSNPASRLRSCLWPSARFEPPFPHVYNRVHNSAKLIGFL